MAYSAEISRSNPSCFLFLIDQSGSTGDNFPGEVAKKKADGVADAINKLLQDLVIRCAKEEGVRDYFHVAVIGYGTNVGPGFGGSLAGKELAGQNGRLRDYKLDHFIPLELGGCPDCQTNLWPESYSPAPGAHEKDVVKNYLHREVCAGNMPLREAQRRIVSDWYQVYLEINP